jgi:hypothetical protein
MKITKILVALSFLFAISTAHAGELTVTGNMEATYHTQGDKTTGNPLGMDRELKFAGSTELDNGITVSVFQDTSDNLGYGNSQIMFGGVAGMFDIYVGSDSDPVDAIDDITPSAYEEANGSGSGTYTSNDIGDKAGQMGIGFKYNVPVLGAFNYKYYPNADSTKNSDNASSGDQNGTTGSAYSASLKTNMGDLPFVGSFLDGATLTTGAGEHEHSRVANSDDAFDLTAAVNYNIGNFSLGVQKKVHSEGESGTTSTTDAVRYKDTIIGIAYAVNDNLSISYNTYDSYKKNADGDGSPDQETTAINIGYTVGGMTIGFQDAQTDNDNYTRDSTDDTRTLGVSVAF